MRRRARRRRASISRRRRPGLSSPWWAWIRPRSFRRLCGVAAVSAVGLGLAACPYGFSGGLLPNVKTVAILPFDNDTPEPALTQEVSQAVREALEGRLGLRVASEATADASGRELDRVPLLAPHLRGGALLRGEHR